ncbi:Hypothetical protein FORC77_0034 [Vibrio vulnificus]|uniref:Uncharacterized protein n=1 Tax=Vibrio vulnificus TaxID=672 RepID=A0AAN1PL69_VIBVL|nr:hypothetical protein FORC53_0032 [Vibrio vulnificus]QBH25757.1 Hypothetical protein FORC77_0034 [Vibrio vulnificus]
MIIQQTNESLLIAEYYSKNQVGTQFGKKHTKKQQLKFNSQQSVNFKAKISNKYSLIDI